MAKQIRAVRHYQDKSAPLRRLADAGIPHIKRDLKAALDHLPELVPADAVEYARHADWEGLKRAIDWTHARGMLKAVFGQVGKVREAAAQLGVRQINGAFARAGRRVKYRKVAVSKDITSDYAFDGYSQAVQDQLRQAQDDLIAELETSARDAIDQIVMDGALQGLGPDEIVDDIRSYIGLTARQSQAVANYRSMLESLDPGALQRQLRNFLEDDTVQAALDAGQPMDAAMVDKLVSDYTDNFLDFRAETIAQTESTRAASLGLQDAYSQAIDRGVFPNEAVKQFWKIDLDERTCPVCLSVPDMNPDGIGIDESFDSIDGSQDSPPIHPNCRCSIEIVTDLDLLPADEVDDSEAA